MMQSLEVLTAAKVQTEKASLMASFSEAGAVTLNLSFEEV